MFLHADKVALGTDYPFPLGEWVPGKLIESMEGKEWTVERKKRLLWENGLAFLGLSEEQFRTKDEILESESS